MPLPYKACAVGRVPLHSHPRSDTTTQKGRPGGRPQLVKKSLRAFSPSCFQNCKINFCIMILQFCRCGGGWNAKGHPDGFLSHFSSLRNFRLDRFFDSLRTAGRPSSALFTASILPGPPAYCRYRGRNAHAARRLSPSGPSGRPCRGAARRGPCRPRRHPAPRRGWHSAS